MHKILLPTDFSENSGKANKYVINIFGKDAAYTLMHAWYMPNYSTEMVLPVDDVLAEEVKIELDKEREALLKKSPDLKIKTKMSYGDAVGCIDDMVEEIKADLIVMGTKGSSGMAEILVGSNTASVIQSVTVPVLAIPEQAEVKLPKKIVFATDLHEISSPKVIKPLKEIVQKLSAHILVLNVMKEHEAPDLDKTLEREKLENLFTGLDYSYHIILADKQEIAHAIDEFIHREKADMVAMIARKANLFDRIFHKSITHKIALHTDIPLLAMHDLG